MPSLVSLCSSCSTLRNRQSAGRQTVNESPGEGDYERQASGLRLMYSVFFQLFNVFFMKINNSVLTTCVPSILHFFYMFSIFSKLLEFSVYIFCRQPREVFRFRIVINFRRGTREKRQLFWKVAGSKLVLDA